MKHHPTTRRRIASLLAAPLLAVTAGAVLAGPASAEDAVLVTARVAKVSSSSITLQPITGGKDQLALWDRKIPVSKNATATLTNGAQVKLSRIKSGTMVTAKVKGQLLTSIQQIGHGVLVNGKYGYGQLATPKITITFKGSVEEVKVLDGRCATTKKVVLGGRGEHTSVATCRYREEGRDYYSVIVNAAKADHKDEVITSLATNGEARIAPLDGTGQPLVARFVGQGSIAVASTSASLIKSGTKVRVEIYANGPNDGKDMRTFKVHSSTAL